MKRLNHRMLLTLVAILLSTLYGCNHSKPQVESTPYIVAPDSCLPSPDWLTSPSLPVEIAEGESFCDFYKFSLQSFVYFMSKENADDKTSPMNFKNKEKYPVYNYASPGSSCSKDLPTLSTSINQAFKNEVIYDNNSNVVYYSVQFTRELCDAPNTGNLPVGTIELKMAWKILTDEDNKDRYVHITKDLVVTKAMDKDGNTTSSTPLSKATTLGLVGIHIIQSTEKHPEMMWGSYEHVDNNPLCAPTGNKEHYSFMNKACLEVLKDGDTANPECGFNNAVFSKDLINEPSQICRVFADGSNPKNILYYVNSKGEEYTPNNYEQNIEAINQLNDAMSRSTYFDNAKVLKNYRIVGGLWVNNIKEPSSKSDNQRGSLEMVNTLLETGIQGDDIPTKSPMLNCFACHGYVPGKTAEVIGSGKFPTQLSHIFSNLKKDPKLQHSFIGHK